MNYSAAKIINTSNIYAIFSYKKPRLRIIFNHCVTACSEKILMKKGRLTVETPLLAFDSYSYIFIR